MREIKDKYDQDFIQIMKIKNDELIQESSSFNVSEFIRNEEKKDMHEDNNQEQFNSFTKRMTFTERKEEIVN